MRLGYKHNGGQGRAVFLGSRLPPSLCILTRPREGERERERERASESEREGERARERERERERERDISVWFCHQCDCGITIM